MRRVGAHLSLAALLCVAAAPAPAPLVGAGCQPQDKDERGLWMQMEEQERELKRSNFVMHDTALNAYVRDVFCRTVSAEKCADIRIYIMRTPYFNASMAPNGMMQVWSGLFLRCRDEAQLSAILGHEYTHYEKRHSLQLFQSAKKNLAAGAWLGMIIPLVQLAFIGQVFENSRDMEREADSGSIGLMARAGYDPHSASRIWEQLRAEMDATALARKQKSRKDKTGGMFATHPPTLERMTELKAQADKQAVSGTPSNGRESYRRALGPYWALVVDDQIKLNDFGGTDFLLTNLASDGWTPDLLFARGELYRARGQAADIAQAVSFYRQALAGKDPPVEAFRGLGLALIRSGNAAEGQGALKQYLDRSPNASDRAMIAMMAGVQP
jgi:beta-barrel assembly-enhancing protease